MLLYQRFLMTDLLFLFERELTFKKFLNERRGGGDQEQQPEQGQEAGGGAGCGDQHWHHLYLQ